MAALHRELGVVVVRCIDLGREHSAADDVGDGREIDVVPSIETSIERPGGPPTFAWEWVEGIPARSSGVVYDPNDVIANSARMFVGDRGGYAWHKDRCNRLDGPWYWCRIY